MSSPLIDRPLWGVFLYVTQVACFFIISLLVKTLAEDFAVTELLLVRFSATLLVLLVIIGMRRNFAFLKTRFAGDHAVRTVCGMTALGLTFVALSNAYIANATAVVLSAPIIATVLAIFVLKETVLLSRMAAVIVGFFGILLALPAAAVLSVLARFAYDNYLAEHPEAAPPDEAVQSDGDSSP